MKKRQTMKKFICLTYALFLLSSCMQSTTKVETIDNENMKIEYLSFFSSSNMSKNDVAKYWSDAFVEKYNKKVYIEYDEAQYYAEEGQSYRELLEKRLDSSRPDDLYIIQAEDVLAFDKKGYLYDLSDLACVKNLNQAALYQSTYNDRVFSIPLSFTGFGFIWNLDILEKYNLSIPKDLESFLNVCEVLKSNGILPYAANKGYSLTVPAMAVGFAKLYSSDTLAEELAALNNGEMAISEYLRDGLEFLAMMIDKGYLDPQQALNSTPKFEDYTMFINGEAGFICSGISEFESLSKSLGNIEMSGLPVLEDRSITVYGADDRLCINPNSKYLDTAIEFIEMVGSTQALTLSASINHSLSSAQNSDTELLEGTEKFAELVLSENQVPNQDFSLYFNTWGNIRDISRELCNGLSVEEAAKRLDMIQIEELELYRNPLR